MWPGVGARYYERHSNSEIYLTVADTQKVLQSKVNTWPSLPRLPVETFCGEPPAFLIKLNGEGDVRSLLRGPGRD